MNDTQHEIVLPHHKLIAFGVARELLLAVRACHISDAKLRDEALRSSKSACLNTAEGAGRVTRADKARSFAIARAETVEAAAATRTSAMPMHCRRPVLMAPPRTRVVTILPHRSAEDYSRPNTLPASPLMG